MQLKNELKSTFTSFWEYLTLRTACQLNIFDEIQNGNNSLDQLHKVSETDFSVLESLILSLIETRTIIENRGVLSLTKKGELLTATHPESIKNACILWGGEHLTAWQELHYTVKTGEPAFEKIYGIPFFNYLKKDKVLLKNYHYAMAEYAGDDYQNIAKIIDFSGFNTVSDVGGGIGTIINNIAKKFPHKNCILFDLPEVIDLIEEKRQKKIRCIKGNFFEDLPFRTDAIILSRVLHDWDDNKAKLILGNCRSALNKSGKIFIAEILNDEIHANMLSLNMRVMCKSYERTFEQYKSLLKDTDLIFERRQKLNDLQNIIIATKN